MLQCRVNSFLYPLTKGKVLWYLMSYKCYPSSFLNFSGSLVLAISFILRLPFLGILTCNMANCPSASNPLFHKVYLCKSPYYFTFSDLNFSPLLCSYLSEIVNFLRQLICFVTCVIKYHVHLFCLCYSHWSLCVFSIMTCPLEYCIQFCSRKPNLNWNRCRERLLEKSGNGEPI